MQDMVSEIPEHERSIAELYRLKGIEYVAAWKRWSMMDRSEKAKFQRLKQAYIDECRLVDPMAKVTDAAAERYVQCSDEWAEYQGQLVELDAEHRLLKIELDALKIRHEEEKKEAANRRDERYLSRG